MATKIFWAGWNDACWGHGWRAREWPADYEDDYAAGYNQYLLYNPR